MKRQQMGLLSKLQLQTVRTQGFSTHLDTQAWVVGVLDVERQGAVLGLVLDVHTAILLVHRYFNSHGCYAGITICRESTQIVMLMSDLAITAFAGPKFSGIVTAGR